MKENFNIFNWLWSIFKPPKLFSWQSLIIISIFLYIIALVLFIIAKNSPKNAVYFLTYNHWFSLASWICILLGTMGKLYTNPVKIGSISLNPWLVSTLISIFIFGILQDFYKTHNFYQAVTISVVIWPILSAGIACGEILIKGRKDLDLPDVATRQKIIILLLVHIIISCWLNFYFLIQTWPQKYLKKPPEDFKKSSFVVKYKIQGK